LEARDDALSQRFAVGVVGLLILVGLLWWARVRARPVALPPVLVSVAAAAVPGTAGALFTGYGVDRAVTSGAHGPGDYLGAGGICLAVAAVAVVVLVRAWEPPAAASR
jgi:hypothetical protein